MISVTFDPYSVEQHESPFFYHAVQYDSVSRKSMRNCKRKLAILLYCEFPEQILQKGFDHIHLRVDKLSEVDYPWIDINEMYSYVRTHCSRIREHSLQMFCLKYWDYFSPTIRKKLFLEYPIGVSLNPEPPTYGKIEFY